MKGKQNTITRKVALLHGVSESFVRKVRCGDKKHTLIMSTLIRVEQKQNEALREAREELEREGKLKINKVNTVQKAS